MPVIDWFRNALRLPHGATKHVLDELRVKVHIVHAGFTPGIFVPIHSTQFAPRVADVAWLHTGVLVLDAGSVTVPLHNALLERGGSVS